MLIYLSMIESEDDRSKFEKTYERYRGLMFYTAMRILSHQQDAEDAVHQAFVSIIENLDKISEPECPKTRAYVVIITERKALDLARRKSKISQLEFDESMFGTETPPLETNELAEAILRLPTTYREIILLRYHYDYSTKEIAKMLGMTGSATQKALCRAKTMLNRVLNGGEKREPGQEKLDGEGAESGGRAGR